MDFCSKFHYLNDSNHIFKNISFEDLKDLFYNNATALVLIGGDWCDKTQAVMKEVNYIAKREGLDTVYYYDPRFVNVFGEIEDLRDCLTLEHKLDYYFIIERLGYKNKNNELVKDTLIQKMDCPTIFAMKNGASVGYLASYYIKDPYIRLEDDLTDKTLDFDNDLTDLIKKIK